MCTSTLSDADRGALREAERRARARARMQIDRVDREPARLGEIIDIVVRRIITRAEDAAR